MSSLIIQDFRNFVINNLRNGTVSAGAHIGKTVCQNAVAGHKGIVRALQHGDVIVSISRDGVQIYHQTVAKGTKSITLSGQSGSGTVLYNVVIDNAEGWETPVVFTN